MLKTLSRDDFVLFAEQMYQMACEPQMAGYPIYCDGIKTKEEFFARAEQTFCLPDEEILLFYDGGEFCGAVHYYYIENDEYLGVASFGAKRATEQLLDEFFEYVGQKYPAASIYLGFPEENIEALSHLKELGFEEGERLCNLTLNLQSAKVETPLPASAVKIDRENYNLFAGIHSRFDSDMYWDCEHILADIDNWLLFARLKDGCPIGAVYLRRDKNLSEIFGVDLLTDETDSQIQRSLLLAAIAAAKADGSRYICYFSDERDRQAAVDAGFGFVGNYVLMIGKAAR